MFIVASMSMHSYNLAILSNAVGYSQSAISRGKSITLIESLSR